MLVDWGEARRTLTPAADLLVGDDQGRYPSANSLQVAGSGETVIIDPSVTVVARGGAPRSIDAVLNSHAHEDHMPGNGLFAGARLHIHEADRLGAASLDGLLDVFGFDGADSVSLTACSTCPTSTSPGSVPTTAMRGATWTTSRRAW